MNYLATVTVGDMVGPEFLAVLGEYAEIDEDHDRYTEFLSEEQAEWTMGAAMSQTNVWDRLWRYGIIVDDDMAYYIPDDYDTDLCLVEAEALFIEYSYAIPKEAA